MKCFQNKMLRILLISYIGILTIACTLVCRYYYLVKRDAYLTEMNKTLIYLMAEYDAMTENFWKYYLPLYSSDAIAGSALNRYFSSPDENLSPLNKHQIISPLSDLIARTDSLRFIALISPSRQQNYIYYAGTERLELLDESFPFLQDAADAKAHMQILGSRPVTQQAHTENHFVIMGGSPFWQTPGKMLFGFHTQHLDDIIAGFNNPFETLRFYIAENNALIYASAQGHTPSEEILVSDRSPSTVFSSAGRRLLVRPLDESPRQSICYFTVDWAELFRVSFAGIVHILLLMLLFITGTSVLFALMIALVNREVSIIRCGLSYIGANHLDYRLPLHFRNEGFGDIAAAINLMTEELQRTVERSYQFELKQREHEMAELMAKFNPHFLYNTLDLFRARCMRNGDPDTAELIAHASTIFRGFIHARPIVTIREELAFSQHYLRLFRARYGEQVRILFNFDSAILDCLIIRNVFQPLIENYFAHGFDNGKADNFLRLNGEAVGADALRFTVDDNGVGMCEEALASLQNELDHASTRENESYGLRNLHQRLRLYYGKGYGLSVFRNDYGGLSVSILVARSDSGVRPDASPRFFNTSSE